MPAITWRNINAPDLSGVARIQQAGADSLQRGIGGIGELFSKRADEIGKTATNNSLNQIQAINSLNGLDAEGQEIIAAAEQGADQDSLRAALLKRESLLQGRAKVDRDVVTQNLGNQGKTLANFKSQFENKNLQGNLYLDNQGKRARLKSTSLGNDKLQFGLDNQQELHDLNVKDKKAGIEATEVGIDGARRKNAFIEALANDKLATGKENRIASRARTALAKRTEARIKAAAKAKGADKVPLTDAATKAVLDYQERVDKGTVTSKDRTILNRFLTSEGVPIKQVEKLSEFAGSVNSVIERRAKKAAKKSKDILKDEVFASLHPEDKIDLVNIIDTAPKKVTIGNFGSFDVTKEDLNQAAKNITHVENNSVFGLFSSKDRQLNTSVLGISEGPTDFNAELKKVVKQRVGNQRNK